MDRSRILALALVLHALATASLAPAHAEVATVRIARQWGLAWMPFVLMERNKIIERRAAEAGLGPIQVEWVQKFHDSNPGTYKVVLASLKEAVDRIHADRRGAAAQYLEVTREKATVDEIVAAISEPLVEFALVPHHTSTIAAFMHRVGSLKAQPPTWKELFFDDVHGLPGS